MVIGQRRRDQGSATLEAVIMTPVLLLCVALIVLGGRVALAKQAVNQAAYVAVRAATVTPSSVQSAQGLAFAAAQAELTSQGVTCHPVVAVDTTGLRRPVGQQAAVTAVVTCVVPISDLLLPGLPGSITLTATAMSSVDVYQEEKP
ncbi:MAG: pilus assembly protein [Propionibacteriaceae bacterium]|jgi:Flp pilus assembly protein TadG|nr:pilus assembly protein [Propionibacteriaceae bacterium]